MLIYDFAQLRAKKDAPTKIDRDVAVTATFLKRSQGLLLSAEYVHVSGYFVNDCDYVTGNFQVQADVVAPSTRSLQPVKLHQSFSFTESYTDEQKTAAELAEEPELMPIADGQINLQEAVEDNLLLSLPSQILTPAEQAGSSFPKGQGWQVVSQERAQADKQNKVNPAFAKLKSLLTDSQQKKD